MLKRQKKTLFFLDDKETGIFYFYDAHCWQIKKKKDFEPQKEKKIITNNNQKITTILEVITLNLNIFKIFCNLKFFLQKIGDQDYDLHCEHNMC